MQLLGPRICELIDRVERRAFEVAAIGDAKLLEGADRRDRREARIIFRACDIAFGLAVEIGIERPVTLVAARISDRNAPGPAEKHGEGIGRRRDAGPRTGRAAAAVEARTGRLVAVARTPYRHSEREAVARLDLQAAPPPPIVLNIYLVPPVAIGLISGQIV